jgi:RNA-binding protein with serine-rich domain 1
MASRSPSPVRGRTRTRSQSPVSTKKGVEPAEDRSQSPRRSPSPRSRSRSRSQPRSPLREPRNGYGRDRSRSRSLTRSRSPERGHGRSYRDRSYSREPSRTQAVQSSKIVVEKLTKNVTEAHLREIFGSYGSIESIDLPLNRQCKCVYACREDTH